MERATQLLHVFYSANAISAADRRRAHDELVALLQHPNTTEEAARYVQAAATAPISTVLDPLALHFALHSLEERAKSADIPIEPMRVTINLLIEFIVSAYRRNGQGTNTIAQHVVLKAASTAVAFGRREWALTGNKDAVFPRTVLQLIGREAPQLPHLFAGTSLLTVLVDDALDKKIGLRAGEAAALTSNLREVASDVLAALEIGMRIKGPRLPEAVPLAAARSIASLVRVHPNAASDAAALLRRCVAIRADRVSAEMMTVLADLYTESNVRLTQNDCSDAMVHAAGLLEAVAMGEGLTGNDEATGLFRMRLMAYVESVARRVIALGVPISALERLFNALMGTCLRWAEHFPDQLPAALDAWITIFEAIDDWDADVSGNLMPTVVQALSQLCVTRCMFSTNAKVLDGLCEDDDDEEDDDTDANEAKRAASDANVSEATLNTMLAWDRTAELVDKLAIDASSISTALMALAVRGETPDGIGGDGDGLGAVSRKKYIAKCVETLVTTAMFNVERVGLAAMELTVQTLTRQPLATADEKYAQDVITATNISYSVCQLVPKDSAPTRAVVEAVVAQLRNAMQGKASPEALFALLRIAASLAPVLEMKPNEQPDVFKKSNAEALSAVAIAVLEHESSPKVASAATFLVLALLKHCGLVLFGTSLPYGPAFAMHNRHLRPVGALMATAIVQWTLLNHGPRNIKWDDAEKHARTEKFRQACLVVFSDFVRTCQELKTNGVNGVRLVEVARGAALLRTVVGGLLESAPQGKEMLWVGAAREISNNCVEAMLALKKCLRNDATRRCTLAAMGCLVGAIRSVLSVCTRQVKREAPQLGHHTIELCIEVARGDGSSGLARVLLQLLLDHVNSVGFDSDKGQVMKIVEASVTMAGQALAESDDSDLGCTAVSVLAEVINRQWLSLWPEDAVKTAHSRVQMAANGEHAHAVYFKALEAVVGALRRPDLAVCRAALLALESLNASRRLYMREASFRNCGAAESALVGAFEILGAKGEDGRKSLADEADCVVWGIAKVDLQLFYSAVLPKVVRSIADCDEAETQRIGNMFGGVTDRPSFVVALHAVVNDVALCVAKRNAPRL